MGWLRTAAFVAVVILSMAEATVGKKKTRYGQIDLSKVDMEQHLGKMKRFLTAKMAHIHEEHKEPPKFKPMPPKTLPHSLDMGCDPGWMGTNCTNPVCAKETQPFFTHDGLNEGIGDMIEMDVGPTCVERFTFPVDYAIPINLYITVTTDESGSTPYARLYDPMMNEVIPCGDDIISDRSTVQKYCTLMLTSGEGLYTAELHSDTQAPCVFLVNAGTFLYPDGGFVQSPQEDVVQEYLPKPNQAISRNPLQGIPSYLAFRMTHDVYPVEPQVVHIYSNGFWVQNFNLIARYKCATPHITVQTFNCTQEDQYYLKFQGIDEHGMAWQRLYEFGCDYPIPTGTYPTGGPPTPAPVDMCYNEGQLYNGTCYCGPFFEGDKCEIIVCLNDGGIDFQKNKCVCGAGYSGDHCEHVSCPRRNYDTNDLSKRALGFVIRSSQSMQAQMDQIVLAAQNITDQYALYHPDYFQSYILSVVRNNAVLFTHEYLDVQGFISAIRSLTNPPTDTDCDDALLLGVTEVLEQPAFQKYQKSPIFIFSDGTANDDTDVRYALLNSLSHFRGQLFFILSDSVTGRCNIALDDVGYAQMRGLAAFSQGQVIKIAINDIASTSVMLAESTFMMNELITNDLDDCSQAPKYNTFFIDENTDYVMITATGTKLSALVTAPNRTTFAPSLWYQSGNLYIWAIDTDSLAIGNWLISMSTLAAGKTVCQYRVSAHSDYDLFIGVTSSLNSDTTDTQPTWNQAAHIVARINNVHNVDNLAIHAEVMITTNDVGGRRSIVYASSGIYRDNCDYYLYFGPFTCNTPNQMFYVSVYSTDLQGHTLLRTTTGFCSASAPTVIPPDGCANGGVMVNGTCICANHYNGPKCQGILCENQGTPLFGKCQCPAGFSGEFCESPACNSINTWKQYDLNSKSLSVLIHDSISTRSVLRTLNDSVSRVIDDIRFTHPNWITSFQLLRFNDSAHTTEVDSSDPNDFINGVRNLAKRNYDNSEISCQDLDLFPALFDTLSLHDLSFGGIVYVFINGVPRMNDTTLQRIYNHLESTKTTIMVIQTATSPCGKDIYDSASISLMSLAEYTGGMFTISMANKAGDIFRSLPTLYSAQLVTENYYDDCTAPTTFYIPVDSLTQALDIVINGDLVGPPVYVAPNSNRFNLVNLWNDVGYGSRADQIIQPCDQGWDQYDNRCFKFGLTKVSWTDAALTCHQQGASLASIFNQGDQDFLSYQAGSAIDYWIGLNYQNTSGSFVWDTPFNTSLTLDSTGFTNWATGQPVMDPGKTCVYDSQSGMLGGKGWNAVGCTQKFAYICQKNVYNQYFTPRDPNSDFLPRGIWQVTIQTDEGSCSVAGVAQTQLRVYTQYTSDIHDDFGHPEPYQGAVENRVIATVMGLLPSTTYSLEYAHLYMDNLTIIQAQPMRHRENCVFDYISSPFQCPSMTFQMMLSGVDNYGYLYQRVIPVRCQAGPLDGECENGAQYYKGSCVCPPGFFGEYCQLIDCQNGGHFTAALGSCECRTGFTGTFCEIPQCTRGGNKPDLDREHRTFVLLVDGVQTPSYKPFLDGLQDGLTQFFGQIMPQLPNWWTSFVGVIFRNADAADHGGVVSSVVTQSAPDTFNQALNALLAQIPYKSTSPGRSVFTAMVAALTAPQVKSRSVAFLILNGVPDDWTDMDMAMDVISKTNTQVNLLAYGDTNPPGNASYQDLQPLFDTIHMSGGAVYFMKTDDFFKPWADMAYTLHGGHYILSTYRQDCSNLDEYIQTGSNQSALVVDIFAEQQPVVKVTSPNDTTVRAQNAFSTLTNTIDVFVALWMPGIWTLGIDDGNDRSGGCMVNVRGQSAVDVMIAFTQDVEEDGGVHSNDAYLFPQAGFETNAIVAAASGGYLQYVQLYDVEERTLQFASPLIPRALCTFPYISQSTFRCDRHSFTVAIDGLDFMGHPFRRMFTIHCVGYIPTRAPYTGTPYTGTRPTEAPITTSPLPIYPTCSSNVPKIDIIIAFDSSASMPKDVFLEIIDQFYELGSAVVFDKDHVRIIAGTYDAQVHFEMQDFNSTVNLSTYLTRLVALLYSGYTGVSGNNVMGLIDYIIKSENAVTPFRTDARKMIIYYSTLGWDKGNIHDNQETGFGDPTKDANDLKLLGVEFFTIGYGSKANATQLQAVSSNCTRMATTSYGLQDAFNYFLSIICNKDPVCK
ncbi:unnamed protein product, partial [Mesorhabditis belari]|uniref:Uncharacterized protein n=1 Tax=Mesorhabditis belari TaxID=2138241 RepID=A0AAF3EZ59_9BILA